MIIPACNEGNAVGHVVAALNKVADWHEILVIDDGSTDETSKAATTAGATVVSHPYNKGNGAAVKTGLRTATGDFVLILDADGQHRAELAPQLIENLQNFDLVIGARTSASQATAGRRLGNRLLALIASYLSGQKIIDLTSGFRAARRSHLLEFIHLLPNGFSTPTTTTLAFIRAGYNIKFVHAEAHTRTGKSKIKFYRDGLKFFLILLRVMTIFSPLRIFAPISAFSLALGVGYALWTTVTETHITNSSVLLIALGIIVFLLGLISEQIATLRFERQEVGPDVSVEKKSGGQTNR